MAGEPMKRATNRLSGECRVPWASDLLDAAAVQHNDAIGERHRLHLIVGHVDHRGVVHALVQLGDLDARRHAQRRVEVRERLVEQEDLRVAHDGAADGDALALAARELLRQAPEILRDLQHVGRFAHALVELLLARVGELQGEGHVVVDRHMRVERIGLEHHGDAALGRRQLVHHLPADLQRAAGDLFQARDHPEKRGLAATDGPTKTTNSPLRMSRLMPCSTFTVP